MGADPERVPASFTVLDSWTLSEMIMLRGLYSTCDFGNRKGGNGSRVRFEVCFFPKGMTASVIWDNHAKLQRLE
jgi:hypothetical protein